MAVDASNNLWITNAAGSGNTGYITEVGATASTGMPSDATVSTACSGNSGACTTKSTNISPTVVYTQITSGTGGAPAFGTPWGIAVGYSATVGVNNVWIANSTGNTLTEMTSTTAGANFGDANSLKNPAFLAVDGAGNLWISDNNGAAGAAVSEFSSTGAVLSPANGVNGSTTIGFSHQGLFNPNGIAVDPSGNVWVADAVGSAAAGSGVFEIVGAAVPTVTPIATALAGTVSANGHGIGQLP
jgi:streptogramin lyase